MNVDNDNVSNIGGSGGDFLLCDDGISEEGKDTGMDDSVGDDGEYASDFNDDNSVSPVLK